MLPKLAGLRQRSVVNCDNLGRSVIHLCQRTLYSVGISSSQLNFIRHRSWRISLAVSAKGVAKPKAEVEDCPNNGQDAPMGRWSEFDVNIKTKFVGLYSPLNAKCTFDLQFILQAPVVQRVDSTIQRIA